MPHAELGLEDADHVLAAQRADAILGPGSGVETRLEPFDSGGVEPGRRAPGLAGHQRRQPAASIAAGPLVDEAWRAAQATCDLVALERVLGDEQHRAIAVALQRPPLAGHVLAEPVQIVGLVERQLHPAEHARPITKARISGAQKSGTIRISRGISRRPRVRGG